MTVQDGSLRLVVEAASKTDTTAWVVYTEQYDDGQWEEDEQIGSVESMTGNLDHAHNQALALALLAGYAVDDAHVLGGWRKRSEVTSTGAPTFARMSVRIIDVSGT